MPARWVGPTVLDMATQTTPPILSTASGPVNCMMYCDGANLQVSIGGNPYVPILMGSATAIALQASYNAGNTIIVSAGRPVTISNAAGVVSNLLVMNENCTATNSDIGLSYSRAIAPGAGTTFSGNAVGISNAPIGTNNCTESGTLVSISHAPIAGAGTITDTTKGLSISMTPVAASTVIGADVTMSANATSYGLRVTHNRATNGSTVVALRLAGASQAVGVEFTDGQNLAVSNANEGRLRYNNATHVFEVSANGGAFAAFGSSTLQQAYTAGAAIVVTGANPVAISNAAAVTSNLLALTDSTTASNANIGVLWTRNAVPALASTWTGRGCRLANTPTGTNNCTENGVILRVDHTPVAGAGTITDTTIGLTIIMTPVAASAVQGAVITMAANSTGQGLVVTHSGGAAGSTSVAIRVTGDNHSAGEEFSDGQNLAISNANEGRLRYNTATQTFQVSLNTAAYVNLLTSASITLQTAYNAGAAIVVTGTNPMTIANAAGVTSNLLTLTDLTTATNANLGVSWTRSAVPALGSTWTGRGLVLSNTPTGTNNCTESGTVLVISHAPVAGAGTVTDTTKGVSVTMTPLTAQGCQGILLTMSANCTGQGLFVTHNGGAAGTTSIAARLTGSLQSTAIELSDGRSVAVSNASEGRLRYNASTQIFEVSLNGAAYTGVATIASASLQVAYNAGASIVVTGANPVSISNAAGVVSNLISLVDATNVSNIGIGISWSRTSTPGAFASYNGSAISISNAPVTTNAYNEIGTLVNISHAPTGAGAATDGTLGLGVTMTPVSASAVRGIVLTMGANSSSAGTPFKIDYRGAGGTLAQVVVGAPGTVFTTATTGLLIDLNTNVASVLSTQCLTLVGSGQNAAASTTGVILIKNFGTQSQAINIQAGNQQATRGLIEVGWLVGSTISGTTIGLDLNFNSGGLTIGATAAVTLASMTFQVQSGANTSSAISITRTGTLGAASNYTGGIISVVNTPTMFAGGTENGVMLSIAHTGTTNAGTDTSTGISVAMTPSTATSAVVGILVTMGANVSASGAGVKFGAGGIATLPHILGPSDQALNIKAGGTNGLNLKTSVQTWAFGNDGSITVPSGGCTIVTDTTNGLMIGSVGGAAGQKLGFWAAAPVVQSTGWSVTGVPVTLKSIAGDGSATLAQVGECLTTLMTTLLGYGLLHA